MTTVKPAAVEILTTLDQDPNVNFFPWEMDVQDVAAGMAKSLHDQGLLSAILTDEQWAAHPGNSVVDQNGTVQIDRPAIHTSSTSRHQQQHVEC